MINKQIVDGVLDKQTVSEMESILNKGSQMTGEDYRRMLEVLFAAVRSLEEDMDYFVKDAY